MKLFKSPVISMIQIMRNYALYMYVRSCLDDGCYSSHKLKTTGLVYVAWQPVTLVHDRIYVLYVYSVSF